MSLNDLNRAEQGKQEYTGLRRIQLSSTTLGLANAILFAGVAQAQTTNVPPSTAGATNAPAELPEVVVRGQQAPNKADTVQSPKYTEPLRDIPQTITVVPKAIIEQQGATTLQDALRNVSGISLQAGEGGVVAGDNLTIRGFAARSDIFVDGVRDFGGYTRDTFFVDQVEVVKGPVSVYSGRGGTGGSVNLVSKTPLLMPIYEGRLGFGTDEYKRLTLDVNQPVPSEKLPGTALRLNGVWHDADVPGRDRVENSRWGIAPAVTFGLGTPTRVTLSYFHLEQDNLPDYGQPWVPTNNIPLAAYHDKPAPVPRENFYGLIDRDFEKTRTYLPTARIEQDIGESLTLRNLFRYGVTERDSAITAPRFANPTNTLINRQLQSRDQEDTIIANQTSLTYGFDTGPVEHKLVPGIEYYHETSENFLRSAPPAPLADLFDPNPDDPYTGKVTRNGGVNRSTGNSFAVFAFDTVKLHEQWELAAGIRWDYFDLDYTSRATNGVVTELSRVDKVPTGRVGLVYKPLPNGSIYASFGTAFNPATEGLTLGTNTASLKPEESVSYEVGTKWDFLHDRLRLSAALFRIDKLNAQTPGPPGDAPIVLEGEQRINGVEFEAVGSITKEWAMQLAYSFQDSEVRDSNFRPDVGNELPRSPHHTLSVWTTYALPFGLSVGGGPRFVDSQFTSTANNRQAPSFWVWNAMVAYNVNKNVSIQLNVYNLADERYLDQISNGHYIPGAARSAVLSANFRF